MHSTGLNWVGRTAYRYFSPDAPGKQVGTASPTSETESKKASHYAHPGRITITHKQERV